MASAFLDLPGLSHFLDKLRLLIVQSDWQQFDSAEMDYIRNKPTISVDGTTLVLTGWMSPVVPITVTQTQDQTISIASSDPSFAFDSDSGTGWIAKGADISISVQTNFPRIPVLPGNAVVNGESLGESETSITVNSDTLAISAEPAEEVPQIQVHLGSYTGGVGFYLNGYGGLSPNPVYSPNGSGAMVYFSQITAQNDGGAYTLAVNTNTETPFTLIDESGRDVLNDPVVREDVARRMFTGYPSLQYMLFWVRFL